MIYIEHYTKSKSKPQLKDQSYNQQTSTTKLGISKQKLVKQATEPARNSSSKYNFALQKEAKNPFIPPLTYSRSTAKHRHFKDKVFQNQPSEGNFESKTNKNFSKSYKTFINLAGKSLNTPKPMDHIKDSKSFKSKIELIGHYIKFENLAEIYKSTSHNYKISDSDCFTSDCISFNKKHNSKTKSFADPNFDLLKNVCSIYSPVSKVKADRPKSFVHKKVVLSNAILNHSPIEEDFQKEIKEKKEKDKHLFSKCNWKGHMKGVSQKRLKQISFEVDYDEDANNFQDSKHTEKDCFLAETNSNNDERILSGKSAASKKTKFNLNKQDGAYTLDYFESFNSILKTPVHDRVCIKKFNKETIESQTGKNKLKFQDINNLLEMKLIKPRTHKVADISLKFTQKNKLAGISNINRQSMLVNKTMIMLPNGKVRIIDNIERIIEAELSAKASE